MVESLFDSSELVGIGIIISNDLLKTGSGEWIVIGRIAGDDIVCINTIDQLIYLWLIQNRDGEHVKIANSFKEFYDNIS